MAKMENTYRMTDRDIRLMIQLRAANADVFTGRKNSAMRGWRAIRTEMGIQGALTAQQLKKKWDNLKDKYRALKNPPVGMETQTSSWRWFHLMDEAMSGRLAGSGSIVRTSLPSEDEEDGSVLLLPKTEGSLSGLRPEDSGALGGGGGTLRDVLELSGIEACGSVEAESRTGSPAEAVSAGPDRDHLRSPEWGESPGMESRLAVNRSQTAVLYATLLPGGTFESNKTPSSSVREEADGRLAELQREWRALEREQEEFDRELIALERDREMLNRDTAALERDRAAVDRDRGVLDRDRVVLDRDRAFLDRDRAFLDRDRVFLERAREDLERERALLRRERAVLQREGPAVDGLQAEVTTEKEVVLQTRFYQRLMAADLDPNQLETRQRLVCLFQRLVEKL